MTVIEFPLKIAYGEDNSSRSICQWFDNDGKKLQGTFIVESLEKVNNDK